MEEFQLLEKENVLEDIKPLPALRFYFAIQMSLGAAGMALVIGIFFAMGLTSEGAAFPLWLVTYSLIGLALWIILSFIVAYNSYNYQHYWITNKRIIYKRGLIGYSICSIPLERISDVIVSRRFLENLLGFGSVHIQSLAGQFTPGARWGSEGNLLAIPKPEETQKLILKLIQEKRKREHLTM